MTDVEVMHSVDIKKSKKSKKSKVNTEEIESQEWVKHKEKKNMGSEFLWSLNHSLLASSNGRYIFFLLVLKINKTDSVNHEL